MMIEAEQAIEISLILAISKGESSAVRDMCTVKIKLS